MTKDKVDTSSELLLSIVTPVYGHYEYLEKCIRSAANQTHKNEYEIIVSDDNSADERIVPLLRKLEKEIPHLKVFTQKQNVGIRANQDFTIARAKGKFIAFLDCDDYLDNKAVETILGKLKGSRNTKYFFTDRWYVDKSGRKIGSSSYADSYEITSRDHYYNLQIEMIATHLKIIAKHELVKLGGFTKSQDGVQDYDIALKFSELYPMEYIPEKLYYHRIHQDSVTSSKRATQHINSAITLRQALLRRYASHSHRNGVVVIQASNVTPMAVGQFIHMYRKDFKIVVEFNEQDNLEDVLGKLAYLDEIHCDSQKSFNYLAPLLKGMIDAKMISVFLTE